MALTGLSAPVFGGRADLSRPLLCLRRYAEDKRFFPDELPRTLGFHWVLIPLPCPMCNGRYAEDKRFFPDELPRTLAAVDTLWLGYSERDKLGDVTW